jgi:hypothetical protein
LGMGLSALGVWLRWWWLGIAMPLYVYVYVCFSEESQFSSPSSQTVSRDISTLDGARRSRKARECSLSRVPWPLSALQPSTVPTSSTLCVLLPPSPPPWTVTNRTLALPQCDIRRWVAIKFTTPLPADHLGPGPNGGVIWGKKRKWTTSAPLTAAHTSSNTAHPLPLPLPPHPHPTPFLGTPIGRPQPRLKPRARCGRPGVPIPPNLGLYFRGPSQQSQSP